MDTLSENEREELGIFEDTADLPSDAELDIASRPMSQIGPVPSVSPVKSIRSKSRAQPTPSSISTEPPRHMGVLISRSAEEEGSEMMYETNKDDVSFISNYRGKTNTPASMFTDIPEARALDP